MKKQNGFTLIELLSVIVLLTLISLMVTPVIQNSLENARKESFLSSVNGVYRAVRLNKEYGIKQEYTIANGKTNPEVSVKGKVEGTGKMIVNENGEIYVSVSTPKYCATKDYQDKKIMVKDGACKNEK